MKFGTFLLAMLVKDMWNRCGLTQKTGRSMRDEVKNDLFVLNAALKNLDKILDFSDVVRPFLPDEGAPNRG